MRVIKQENLPIEWGKGFGKDYGNTMQDNCETSTQGCVHVCEASMAAPQRGKEWLNYLKLRLGKVWERKLSKLARCNGQLMQE